MEGLVIFGAIIFLPILFIIVTYNNLVRLSQMITESWSNVDTELRRRYDLIPNLVETVKAYAKHEREVFEHIAQARAAAVANTGDPASQAMDENKLIKELKSLFAVVENYPELKANQNFLKLQEELVDTEDRIQAARRFYNGNVRDYNTKVQTFPSNLIASIFNFQPKDYFDIESLDVRKPVSVSF
ncbi:MAG: LemA family protein [bacterium]|nr:LemA family protein [bacterium]